MAFVIDSTVDIAAPPDRVWAVLMDLDSYAAWNTQLRYHGGDPVVGGRIDLEMVPASGSGYRFRPTVVDRQEGRSFGWVARTGPRGVFDGEHRFELTPLPDGGTRLRNREEYRGLLSPVLRRLPQMRSAPAGFDRMNRELAAYVESR